MDEVPPVPGPGTGSLDATFDSATHKLTWTVTYAGLSGTVTAAHFHGPAEPGKNAPPLVPLSGAMASPIKGEATLTPGQQKDFEAGRLHFSLHTTGLRDPRPSAEEVGSATQPVRQGHFPGDKRPSASICSSRRCAKPDRWGDQAYAGRRNNDG